jgi:hypothetical protein
MVARILKDVCWCVLEIGGCEQAKPSNLFYLGMDGDGLVTVFE